MHTGRCGNTCGQKCRAKGSRKEAKMQEFMYSDTTNVERELYDFTGHNLSHRNSYKSLEVKFGGQTRETFNTCFHYKRQLCWEHQT